MFYCDTVSVRVRGRNTVSAHGSKVQYSCQEGSINPVFCRDF